MPLIADDLATVYAASPFTVSVTAGAASGYGFLDVIDAADPGLQGMAGITRERRCRVLATQFPAVDVDQTVTVDGTSYLVRQVFAIGDGRERDWWLVPSS